jgi:hypothetical protein
MADERKNIDNLFRDHLVGHKVSAPAGAWDRLQADLQPRKKRAAFLYIKLAAASLLLLLAFGAGYLLSEFGPDNTNLTASKTEVTNPGQQIENTSSLPDESNQIVSDKFNDDALHAADKELLLADADQDVVQKPLIIDVKSDPDQKLAVAVADQIDQKTDAINLETTPSHEKLSNESYDILHEELVAVEDIAVVAEDEVEVDEKVVNDDAMAASPDPQFTNDELEKMTPEQLHLLLVGDDDYSDEVLAADQVKSNPNWTIGGQLSPTYSYRNLNGNAFEAPDENIDQSYFNDNENGLTTIGGGISLAYNFNERLSLGSGLYLSRIGQENNDVVAYDSPDSQYMYKLASSSGTVTINPTRFAKVLTPIAAIDKDSIPGDYLVNGTFVQNLDYLEVPVVLNYKVLNKRFSINLNGGLSPGILVNNRSYFNVEDEKIQTGTTENIKPMIYNSVLGIGMAYDISKKVSVNLSPTFKYSLSPVNSSSSGINYHPYSISWFTGISYKL